MDLLVCPRCHACRKKMYTQFIWNLLNLPDRPKGKINSCKGLEELAIRLALHGKRSTDRKFVLPSTGVVKEKKEEEETFYIVLR